MKFGLFYLPAFDADVHKDASTLYSQIIEQTILGEQLGFESVWVSEHHFSPYGGDIPNPPLLMMALAQHTRTMRLASAGVALPINRPLNTAEQLAMVDAVSGGRVDIGVVRAFLNFEYEALNVEMSESRARFNEGVEIILGTWANESFSFDGTFNSFKDVQLRPRPVQRRPRIIVGAVGTPETVQYAGQRGFDLMVIPYATSLEGVRKTVDLYHQSLRDAGRDPADHSVMGSFHCYVEADVDAAIATIREPILRYVGYVRDAVADDSWSDDYPGYEGLVQRMEALIDFDKLYDRRSIFGDPAHACECIDAAIDAGITEITLVTQMPGLIQEKILESMRLFAKEVMPRYQ